MAGRGKAKATLQLEQDLLALLERMEPPVSVRQVYYQATVHIGVDKTEAGYRKVQQALLAMRRDGRVAYSVIADGTRWRRHPPAHDSLWDCLWHAQNDYRQALWRDIDHYVEVWCEKDALAGVLFPVTSKWDVSLMVARGYTSESYVYSAAEEVIETGKPTTIYYVGDFDPSGWQMGEFLEERFRAFGMPDNFQFVRLGVTEPQARELEARGLARETKATDSRTKAFFQQFGHGRMSVELDAIEPSALRQMVSDAIEQHLPEGALERVEAEEETAKEVLEEMMGVAVEKGLHAFG
jgi:hypothetical protein